MGGEQAYRVSVAGGFPERGTTLEQGRGGIRDFKDDTVILNGK